MPPKPKFTREQIVQAAYALARSEGIDAVMAREVGKRLGSTASPIFTVFSGMSELKQEVYLLAKRRCIEYLSEAFDYRPAFKAFGMRWIHFAIREPHLYALLILRGSAEGSCLTNDIIAALSDRVIGSIREAFGLNDAQARQLLNQMVIYASGLAAIQSGGMGQFSEEQISRAIGEACLSMVVRYQILDGTFDPEAARVMLEQPGRMPAREATP